MADCPGERRTRTQRREMRLDGVSPTAVEALDRKRSAMRMLRGIDALLQDDTSDDHTIPHKGKSSAAKLALRDQRCPSGDVAEDSATTAATPGPGAYSPKTRVVNKQTHFMASFDAYSGRTPRALPWKQLGKRKLGTPGPGAYAVARADTVTKPRVIAASFRPSKSGRCSLKPVRAEATQPRLPAVAESSAATTKSCKLVAYMSPTKPNYRTREQKLKVRAIMTGRQRWTRLGFYDVSHTCVERRIGMTKIVPMARQSNDGKQPHRHHLVQLRQRVRQWRQHEISRPKSPKESDASKSSQKKPQAWKTEKERASFRTTQQWLRAQTRELLRVKAMEAKLSAVSDGEHTPGPLKKDSTMFMPAHAMSKQLGRDVVQCRHKELKIIRSFSARVPKGRIKVNVPDSGGEAPDHAGATRANGKGGGKGRGVQFAKTTGRDDLLRDKHGVFLLGKKTEHDPHDVTLDLNLDLDHIDTLLRPRAPRALIGKRNDDDERFPMTTKVAKEHESRSVLEPKFEIVEKSTVGHRFVRFEKQLDRPEFITSNGNRLDSDLDQLDLSSDFSILEKLKFPGGNIGNVNYRTMQGREDIERLDCPPPVDVVYELSHGLKLARAPVPVDMGKMLARDTAVEVGGDSDKGQVLCKLRENHDEIEKAMRLLSKFKRQDVGFVDMKKGQVRFKRVEVENQVDRGAEETRAPRLELSVLSSKARADRTLVDMRKSFGRRRENKFGHLGTSDQLVLSPKVDVLSKRKRSVGLVNMKAQVPRLGFHQEASFLDPTRDSATTRFLQRHAKI